MSLKLKKMLTSKSMIRLVYHFIRIYSWTFRLRVENEKEWMDHLRSGGRVLLCVWHQQFFSLIRYFKEYAPLQPSLMISQSKDGELIAGVANLTGWHTVRGSSSRGGRKALVKMIRQLQTNGLAAHILDGPRGPAGVVKEGAVYLAQGAGAVIVPVHMVAENAWIFNSWDQFLLPIPFSKVTIKYGDMIQLEPDAEKNMVEKQRFRIETIMQPHLVKPDFDKQKRPGTNTRTKKTDRA